MNVEIIKTIILRYRDLSNKNTIELHKKIINSKGFVWWGWWAKPQEKISLEVFSELKSKAELDGIDIYLLDSGKFELRKAKCVGIDFGENGEFINTPVKTATPEYYKNNQYMLWFKFESISEPIVNSKAELNCYSYVKVDEHFANGISPFSAFDNKVVYDCDELIEQQCTIWYLREKETGDRDQRIVSYEPGVGNYDNTFSIVDNDKILWLSDMHFSSDFHEFKATVGSNNSLLNVLNRSFELNKIKSFSRVISTGDFSFTSSEDEFNLAKSFFSDLASGLGVDPSTFIFCPGNHDMKYSEKAYTNDNDPVELNFEEAKENYRNFYQSVKGITANEYMNSIHRIITTKGKLIEIISLNTCILQQNKEHFRGMGFVGNDQLEAIRKELKLTDKINPYRIIVMHHNLLPALYSEMPVINPMYSIMLDSEAITQFCLNNNISLVLHGHIHKRFYSKVVRPVPTKKAEEKSLTIVGLGSTGVVSSHLSEGNNNQYAVISFEEEYISIKVYEIFSNGSSSDGEIIEYKIAYGG